MEISRCYCKVKDKLITMNLRNKFWDMSIWLSLVNICTNDVFNNFDTPGSGGTRIILDEAAKKLILYIYKGKFSYCLVCSL